jgi:hypothetical protein
VGLRILHRGIESAVVPDYQDKRRSGEECPALIFRLQMAKEQLLHLRAVVGASGRGTVDRALLQ